MAQVEHAVGDAGRGAVGLDVAQPDGDHGAAAGRRRAVSRTTGAPTMSSARVERRRRRSTRDFASSTRWSPGSSGPSQIAQYSPPAMPQSCGEAMVTGDASAASAPALPSEPSRSVCVCDLRRRPFAERDPAARPLLVPVLRAAPSPSDRAASPDRSRRRCRCPSASGPTSAAPPAGSRCAGLGTAKCGYLWIHGPTMPLTGASMPPTRRETAFL